MTGSKCSLVAFLFLVSLTLAILLVSTPTNNGVYAMQSNQANPGAPTPTLGVVESAKVDLYASAVAPVGELNDPYIILTAFGNLPVEISIGIRGSINETIGFTCYSTPCKLPLSYDSIIRFLAYTDLGHTSQEYTAVARISQPSVGVYQVILESFSPDKVFVDSCFSIWGGPAGLISDWADMPRTPFQLDTDVTLHYLAGRLIQNGIVDVSDCPTGGIVDGAPDGCGIEHARQAMIEWQNKFDFDIWMVSKAVSIPPKILKTLILQESQFWPGNTRYFLDEFGLAQINDLGADVALRWDINLYQEVCASVLSDCGIPYYQLPPPLRAMVRGALLDRLNAQCPTCNYGLNVEIAHASIYTIAGVLHANCWETRYILDRNKASPKNYEDFWKLTLVSYHSGFGCLDVAIEATAKAGESIDWPHVSEHLSCQGARDYVDNFWYSLITFDNKTMVPNIVETASVNMIPTRTMMPSPMPTSSRASVHVHVYVDKNENNIPEPSEGVSGVSVKLTLSNGMYEFGTTNDQGEADFNLTGRTVGEDVNVSLVNL
ncbi:MAG: hypothetical protein NTV38_04695, partial [Chloroflexi bacterium]|nr:hypothetical protein [Chloroflexota bacterium]